MSKSKILYTDLSVEKCRERFNEDITAYCGIDFSGMITNDDFYIDYVTKGRYRVSYKLRANLKQEGETTQIQYELSNTLLSNKSIILLLFIPLIVVIFLYLGSDENFFIENNIWVYLAAFYGVIVFIILPVIIITNYINNRKLVKFVESMFNIQ
ncbi:MAG: hypothetical protein FWD71_17575 [Oscillospiraceae bacterium]|nr:hypothetical protein [Oscillospiraceae bacterium]